jgi:hypothetical protein
MVIFFLKGIKLQSKSLGLKISREKTIKED